MVSNLYQQAEELERAGRLVEAEERWRDIVRVEPSGESLARLGRLYLWRGAVEDGERLLREAIARFPDDSSPHFHLGVYLTHEGELEEAKELLQKSVDLDEWAPALVCLGKVHRRLQETESARRCLERALVLEPENAEAYFLLGLTHQDDARHAAELFEKAVALDPEYADAWRELALVQWRLGDLVAAEEQARKAIALDDRSAWNHDYLGVILTAAHKYEEALQELRKALELWPDSRLFYCHLGDALLRLDQDADAEAAYKRALALDVNYYLANLRMGQMRQMQGHLADARRYMERAVHAAPSNREARRVLSELPPEGEHGPEQ